METIIKTFKRRSSATDVLREIGVTPRDYDLFIEAQEGGAVALNISLAKSHVASVALQKGDALANMAATLTKAAPPAPKAKRESKAKTSSAPAWPYPTSDGRLLNANAPKKASPAAPKKASPAAPKKAKKATSAPKEAKRTVTSVARELIVAGKTNAEVWEVLKTEFKLDDGKKSYPAWYRRDCVKRGLIQEPKK